MRALCIITSPYGEAPAMTTITRQDIRALKHADSITFHYAPAEERSEIRAHQDGARSSTGYDQTHAIPAASRVTSYERGATYRKDGHCFAMVSSSRYSPETQTWLALLREGDELEILWVGGNSSDNVREAGLTVDECWVEVKRTKTNRRMRFYVDHRVTPPRSTARMVDLYV
jgi:hypothetical protein